MAEQPQPISIFAVLGFLEEYAGRRVVQNSERVETFDANEATQAKRFDGYLKRLIADHHLHTTLRHETVGKCMHFYSREVTHLIDSYYLDNGLTGSNSDGTPAYTRGAGSLRSHAGRISAAIFPAEGREARISYLTGAYLRWGKGNCIRMAYGVHKVQLLKQLLQEVGCPNVVIVYPDPEDLPAIYQIAFEPTPELSARLKIQGLQAAR